MRETRAQARIEDITPTSEILAELDTASSTAYLPVSISQEVERIGTRRRDIAAARLKHFEQMTSVSQKVSTVVPSQTCGSPLVETRKPSDVIDLTLD